MNKNVSNFSFGIGNLIFGRGKPNLENPIKEDGVSEFSSCLSKLSSKGENNKFKKESVSNGGTKPNNIKSDKIDDKALGNKEVSDDNTEVDNADTVKADNEKADADVVKDDNAVNTREDNVLPNVLGNTLGNTLDDTLDEINKDDELDITDIAAAFAVGGMTDMSENSELVSVDADLNTLTDSVSDNEIKLIGQVSEDIGAVEYVQTEGFDLVSADNMENQSGDINLDIRQNVMVENEETAAQNIILNDSYVNHDNSPNLNSEGYGIDKPAEYLNVDTAVNDIKIDRNKEMNGNIEGLDLDNAISLDENISNDVVSVKISNTDSIPAAENIPADNLANAVNVPLVNQETDIEDSDTTVKIEEPKSEFSDIRTDRTAVYENVKNSDENLEGDEETDNSSDFDGFGDILEDSLNRTEHNSVDSINRASFEPNTEVRTVNLHNAAARNINAAQAVQNTIIQNISDMMGRVESKSMELMLNPQELGKIVIRMQSTADGLNIKIIADNLDINKGLEMRMFQIENTIKAQGVTLNNIEIEHSSVSENSAGFSGFENSAHNFEGFANQNSGGNSRKDYIDYTEYSYGESDDLSMDSISEGVWRIGNSNVEFLA